MLLKSPKFSTSDSVGQGLHAASQYEYMVVYSQVTTEGNIINTNQQMSSGQKIISTSHVVCICPPMAMEHNLYEHLATQIWRQLFYIL